MTNLFKLFCLGFILLCFTSSCISYKNVPYFQDLDSTQVSITAGVYKPQLIQKNDILGVYINIPGSGSESLFGASTTESEASSTQQTSGFLVDEMGEIKLPVIGKVKVEGLTTMQVTRIITDKVAQYTKVKEEPSVSVRLLNFKISVTGDVGNPGVYPVSGEKISVLEALSLAGDLKITGKREVLIIRQEEGKFQFSRIDMRSKKLFSSPDFYLKNNDVVYVEPSVERLERNENFYKNVTLALSALTVITLVVFRLF